MSYLVSRTDGLLGPFSKAEVEAMLAIQQLTPADLIASVQDQPWQSIESHPDFAAGSTAVAPAASGLTLRQMYEAFIGPEKAAYYIPRFEQFDAGGSAISWNWPGALITQLWMLGRGMLLWGFLIYPVLHLIASLVIGLVIVKFLGPQGYPVIQVLLLLLSVLVMGAFSNKIFHHHVRKKIEQSGRLGLSDTDRRDWIIRRGAASFAWIAVVLFLGVAVIGILAAIAIPAYQDYITRSKVAEGLVRVASVEHTYADYVNANKQPPTSMDDLGLSPTEGNGRNVSSIRIGAEKQIVVTFQGAPQLEGTTLEMAPVDAGGKLSWTCHSIDVPAKYLPKNCRG